MITVELGSRIFSNNEWTRAYTLSNVTQYLFTDSVPTISSELERQAFQRVVEDVSLKFSNFDNYFTNLLSGATAQSRFVCRIKDVDTNTVIFLGEIDNTSITFDVTDESVSFDVFSLNNVFWKRAEDTRAFFGSAHDVTDESVGIGLTPTLSFVIQAAITQSFKDICDGVIDYRLATRYINNGGYNYTYGVLQMLDVKTTIKDLFTAFAYYYNCEFFINPSNEKLIIQKRQTVGTASGVDLTNLLIDGTTQIKFLDDSKYDYVKTIISGYPLIQPAVLSTTSGSGFNYSNIFSDSSVKYYVTSLVNINGVTIESTKPKIYATATQQNNNTVWTIHGTLESGRSGVGRIIVSQSFTDTLMVGDYVAISNTNFGLGDGIYEIQGITSGIITIHTNTNVYFYSLYYATGSIQKCNQQTVVLNVPVSLIPNAVGRKVYREYRGLVYLVKQFDNNTETSFTDNVEGNISSFSSDTSLSSGLKVYIGYRDNAWLTPVFITEYSQEPLGNIFDATEGLEKLSFYEGTNKNTSNAIEHQYYFYGAESDFGVLWSQWIDLMKVKLSVNAKAKVTNLRVNDGVTLTLPKYSITNGTSFIVKKANIDLINEETELELISA